MDTAATTCPTKQLLVPERENPQLQLRLKCGSRMLDTFPYLLSESLVVHIILLSFRAESLVFQFTIQKRKD
jgi:hypothetical protein